MKPRLPRIFREELDGQRPRRPRSRSKGASTKGGWPKTEKTEERVILETKKSGVSMITRKTHRPSRAAQAVGSRAGLARPSQHQGSPSTPGGFLSWTQLTRSGRFRWLPQSAVILWVSMAKNTGNIHDQLRVPVMATLLSRTFIVTHAVHTRSLHQHVSEAR